MSANKIDWSSMPFELTETDRENLLLGDEHFKPHTWDELKHIIATNDLSVLKRKPSDLQRYIIWTRQIKSQYGSMTDFVCKERLHWTPSSTAPTDGQAFECKDEKPFASPEDYKILRNDWPYGMEEGIVHIVVWLKTRIPVQNPEGYLLPESKVMIQDFVHRKFEQPLMLKGEEAEDHVMWFKNWVGLQSVRGLDHFHVLVRNVPEDILTQWIGPGNK